MNKWTKYAILAVALIVFAFSLLHASWLADESTGKPKLIADHALPPVMDTQGCTAPAANSGYGGQSFAPDIGALQMAVGMSADGIRVTTERKGEALVLARQFDSKCPADLARPAASLADISAALSAPTLFWQVSGADNAALLLDTVRAGSIQDAFIGDDAAVKVIKTARPEAWAFSISGARKCASDYRASLSGAVPESCKGGTMLLTMDDLGFTLWGWPNRFLQRMQDAETQVIIAEDVVDGRIKGLTDMHQYGDIAHSYNGWIWIDKIEELGLALKR